MYKEFLLNVVYLSITTDIVNKLISSFYQRIFHHLSGIAVSTLERIIHFSVSLMS